MHKPTLFVIFFNYYIFIKPDGSCIFQYKNKRIKQTVNRKEKKNDEVKQKRIRTNLINLIHNIEFITTAVKPDPKYILYLDPTRKDH